MEFCSTADSAFIEQVANWIDSDGEVFLVIHFPHRESPVVDRFTTLSGLQNRISHLPPSATVAVCKSAHVGFNGVVDETFISSVLGAVSPGQDWAVFGDDIHNYLQAWWSDKATGNTLDELQSVLRSTTFYGKSVRAGALPAWRDSDSDAVATAVVPGTHIASLLPRFSLRTLAATVFMVALSIWQIQNLGATSFVSVPWSLAIAFLLLGRQWKWRMEAVYVFFVLGIPGFMGSIIQY